MDDPLKGYFNHQGVRHIGFKNHRKYRRSYHGIPQPPTPPLQCQTTQLKPRPSSIYPLNSATINNQLLHSDGTKTVYMGIILDPTSDLDPITRLTAVSLTTTHQSP
ncbi:hypothetical protein D6C82_03186 [Aureobasidium pullulans]|nr:hypothetical protein D6C82_03186 [Aureobasidium pullulans]